MDWSAADGWMHTVSSVSLHHSLSVPSCLSRLSGFHLFENLQSAAFSYPYLCTNVHDSIVALTDYGKPCAYKVVQYRDEA